MKVRFHRRGYLTVMYLGVSRRNALLNWGAIEVSQLSHTAVCSTNVPLLLDFRIVMVRGKVAIGQGQMLHHMPTSC